MQHVTNGARIHLRLHDTDGVELYTDLQVLDQVKRDTPTLLRTLSHPSKRT